MRKGGIYCPFCFSLIRSFHINLSLHCLSGSWNVWAYETSRLCDGMRIECAPKKFQKKLALNDSVEFDDLFRINFVEMPLVGNLWIRK